MPRDDKWWGGKSGDEWHCNNRGGGSASLGGYSSRGWQAGGPAQQCLRIELAQTESSGRKQRDELRRQRRKRDDTPEPSSDDSERSHAGRARRGTRRTAQACTPPTRTNIAGDDTEKRKLRADAESLKLQAKLWQSLAGIPTAQSADAVAMASLAAAARGKVAQPPTVGDAPSDPLPTLVRDMIQLYVGRETDLDCSEGLTWKQVALALSQLHKRTSAKVAKHMCLKEELSDTPAERAAQLLTWLQKRANSK